MKAVKLICNKAWKIIPFFGTPFFPVFGGNYDLGNVKLCLQYFGNFISCLLLLSSDLKLHYTLFTFICSYPATRLVVQWETKNIGLKVETETEGKYGYDIWPHQGSSIHILY